MQIRTDLEYKLLFLLSLPLGNAFLLSLAEGKVISDVGVYLGNENRDKTTSYIGQSGSNDQFLASEPDLYIAKFLYFK